MSETLEVPGTSLVGIKQPLTAVQIFAPGKVQDILKQIEADARSQSFDCSTSAGRDACRAYAYKLARSKTALDEAGKDLTEQWRTKTNKVNAERRAIRETLDALAEEVRAPLTAFENAEKERVSGHEAAIKSIADAVIFSGEPTSAEIEARIDLVQSLPARDWREFEKRAKEATAATLDNLTGRLATTRQREKDAADAAEFRRQQEERQREEAARLQAEREARIAEEAAERARIAAEQAAAEERAAAAQREREADRRAAQAEADRLAAIAQAEADRIREAEAAAQRQAEAVENERKRIEAEQEQARVRAEQQRKAEEAEATRRAANQAHRQKINREILAAFEKAGIDDATGKKVITAIVQKVIPHVSIAY